MSRAKQAQKNSPIRVPFEGDERKRFYEYLKVRGAKVGPFLRQLILTVMDENVGKTVEDAMIHRGIPF